MRALTVRQPWASLICCSAKRYETRSWPAPKTLQVGDLLAIHSGAWQYTDQYMRHGWQSNTLCMLRSYLDDSPLFMGDSSELPMGEVLCICRFKGWRRTEEIAGGVSRREQEIDCGDFTPGRFAWELDVMLRFQEPIPARGRQGLWWWEAPAWIGAPLRLADAMAGQLPPTHAANAPQGE